MPILGSRAAGAASAFGLTSGGPPFMDANGGSVSTSGDYKLHTFNSGGSFIVNALGTDGTYGKAVYLMAVAGGGGGGGGHGGGGGAGGMVDMTNTLLTIGKQTYSVNIGSGGSGGAVAETPAWRRCCGDRSCGGGGGCGSSCGGGCGGG